jgi:hypothetical protein
MFDDSNTKEPEDIFGKTDKAAPGKFPAGAPTVSSVSPAGIPQQPQIAPLRPAQPQSALPAGERVMLEEPKKSWVKLLVTIIVAVLVLLGVAGWLLFRGYFLKSQVTAPVTEEQKTTEEEITGEVFPEPETTGEVPAEETTAPADMDGDGLSDDEELMVGTDPSLADTDGDQLGDKDEVKVYKTDPLNPDTDGDTFLDGEEVKNGYDPKGKGKLFEVPAPASQ